MIEFGKKETRDIRNFPYGFPEVVGAIIIFLHRKGLKMDDIRETLHNSIDELVNMVEDKNE